jgi:tRNA pseudouridine32 synthase/23S rRNA pseudouridine746 synthase/23S rRNA pseudouridine1911/1915/1917 synthase
VLDVLHRSDDLLVLNKPANVSLLADRSGAECYWNQLKRDLGATKPHLVHRLDKGTSGVLLIALNIETQRKLTRAFEARSIDKFYLAWVVGKLELTATHTIDLALKKGRKSRYRVAGQRSQIKRRGRVWQLDSAQADAAQADGHASITHLRTLSCTAQRSLLLLRPRTGRSHQLRVHLAWIGHPILGDHLYGKPDESLQQAPRLQLHCHRLVVPEFGSFATPPETGWLTRQGEERGS